MAQYQNGGWYPVGSGGKALQFWDGQWYEQPVTGANGSFNQGQNQQQGGGVPSFSFNYEEEAQKAYGELGPYYDRILKESKGDLNLALSRLTEDYKTGTRIKQEDTTLQKQDLAKATTQTTQNVQANSNARGIYQKSGSGQGGFGLADENLANQLYPLERQGQNIDTSLTRYMDAANLNKSRTETDLNTKQTRYESDLEQKKRLEAANIANSRGSQAYAKFSAGLV